VAGYVDTVRMKIGQIQTEITKKKKANNKEDCKEEIDAKNKLEAELKLVEEEKKVLDAEFNKKYLGIGNIVHESVVVSKDEAQNEVIRTWGTPNKMKVDGNPGSAHHHQILWWIGGYDPDNGRKVAGHKGYFLKGPAVLLNQALINYGLKFLQSKGYELVQPPYFMKKDVMAKTAQLSDFDDQLYKVKGGEEDYYLIATAEQPISTMYMDEWFDNKDLPIKFAGVSPCFRKEAGAHGRDIWGIFRVHQFEKVEQFIICKPVNTL
jgi:seryl-tRNA synthetase